MEKNRAIQLIYTFFVGLLIALFVGVGINTFYVPPKAPEYPAELNTYGKEPSAAQIAAEREFNKANDKYRELSKPYNRNVSMLTLVAAVALLAGSMFSQKRIRTLADGIMLGGLFTLLYGIGRGFASENTKYVFVIVTLSLVAVLYLGYDRFVRGVAKEHLS